MPGTTRYKTVAGLELRRTTYLGDHAWEDAGTGRFIFYLALDIPHPAPRGSRIRSGRNYSPKWKCLVDGSSWPYIGAWYETITEIIERLDRENILSP